MFLVQELAAVERHAVTFAALLEWDTTYTYDGLDRRVTRCEGNSSANAETCTDGTNFDYSYVGASELLSGAGRPARPLATTTTQEATVWPDALDADDPGHLPLLGKDANGPS